MSLTMAQELFDSLGETLFDFFHGAADLLDHALDLWRVFTCTELEFLCLTDGDRLERLRQTAILAEAVTIQRLHVRAWVSVAIARPTFRQRRGTTNGSGERKRQE